MSLVAVVPTGEGFGCADGTRSWLAPTLPTGARLVWWNAPPEGRGATACWDLAAVGGLVHGLRRSDPAAVWAAAFGLPSPPVARARDLFGGTGDEPVDDAGQIDGGWYAEAPGPERAVRWAELALSVQRAQQAALGERRSLLVAYAESAVALLCREMEAGGLPFDAAVAGELLTAAIGPDGAPAADRDRAVLDLLPPGESVDLRSLEQVRRLLARTGLDLPDTRSWRLEPHAAASPLVAALLAWRKGDRLATTYGWRWLAEHVRGGRLRGPWQVADGGAGRMTAGNGLHNLPAELRPAVRAEAGHVLVGADLGQVEPRVLAVVSGDPALAAAATEADLYAPVAAALRVERAVAKVAVLAAMYGQTSGAAGQALRDLDRVYGRAMAYLRGAERVGREGGELRTYGGRLLRFDGETADPGGRGRYARNAVVQGAAAELFKAWAATVRAGLAGTGGEIVLCLHDELLLHVPAAGAGAAQALLTDALAATVRWWAPAVGVRFVADVRVGASWPEVH